MSDTMHTFTPNDNSLSERVGAYHRVHQDFANVSASMEHMYDDKWVDSLGDKEEIELAHNVLEESLRKAYSSISQTELVNVVEQGLMSDREAREFIQEKRKQEMKESRASNQDSESSNHSQKQ